MKDDTNTTTTMTALLRRFCTPERAAALKGLLGGPAGRSRLVYGAAGSSAQMMMASLPRRKVPYLVVAEDADDAGYIYQDLVKVAGERSVCILPSGYKRDIRFGQIDPPAQILRTEALASWGDPDVRWVVTSPEGLAEKVPAPGAMEQTTLRLSRGDSVVMADLADRLHELGFRKTDYVYEPGQYARRGSIFDIYSYSAELPYRLDFFGDEIDSIRVFNVETQLSEQQVESVSVTADPALSEGADGIPLTRFVSKDTVVITRSAERVVARVAEITSGAISSAVALSGEGDADAMSHTVDAEEFSREFLAMKTLHYTPAPSAPEGTAMASVDLQCTPQAIYHKNFDLLATSLTEYIARGYKVYIMAQSAIQTDRLKSIFSDRGDDIPFTPVAETLHQGFADAATLSCCFTDHQIFDRFHKYALKSDKARTGRLALSIKELNQIEIDDYIVHIDHGVGRFGGLVRTDVNGRMQEMVKLIYQNDDIIFVSIHSLHKLSKYRGKEGVPPKINRLGSGAWNKLKERAKTRMKDIARDLIKLYAARREQKGFAFSPDSYLQHELEAGFIYEETPDQLSAVEAVKTDMESDRPMDRLVCGDVGFGKTEVAVRAAFKAATDGKQTAVLVPTTVLANQHYHTFSQRLKDLPVRVDFLSRARRPKEVKEILSDLEAGKIDILIGTHKLIGKSVKFKDLGLLVIDEEQKFGVAVKEKLKQLKVNVDTLTMTATPIPRTLQFSLMGARDLSSINTPPSNRHPILTSVVPLSDAVVSEAVEFEMSRGGQVFFVCNRIEQLDVAENMLRRLIPDVRLVKAHGQMPPEKLEKAIADFANHEYDVLLCTTIIESGIDMPNVNTMLVNNAQNFGLSELHQLRGRVGRSSRKAFCYLLTPPGGGMTPVARRRLQAIESFSDLGSGIHIAMQDLDIRGAGNLLGAEQSGFIADLGYEAYQKILKESVLELRTEEFADTFAEDAERAEEEFAADCAVDSDMELLIPAGYVPQEGERISLYQRLDNMDSDADTEAFRKMLADRFGPVPEVTEELIRIVPLRRVARRLGIEKLSLKQGRMYLYFVDASNKAYYQSAAFGRVLNYVQRDPAHSHLRDVNGRRSIVIDDVKSVRRAFEIMSTIANLETI